MLQCVAAAHVSLCNCRLSAVPIYCTYAIPSTMCVRSCDTKVKKLSFSVFDKRVVLFIGTYIISNSRSPISGNKTRGIVRIKHQILYACACVCVRVSTHRSCDFSAGWHERVCLLHNAAGEVANTSLLLAIIRVLYLQTDDTDKRC